MKTFAEHLQELKIRLMVSFAVLGAGSLIGFLVHKPVEVILQKPLNQTLYYSNPAGGLSFVMQIALGVGFLLALPVLLYQLLQFTRPAIKPIKTKHIAALLLSSLVLTALGVVYAYVISLPAALHFLVTFNSSNVKALISVSDYMKFLFAYLAGTVLAFQLPLLLFFANRIRRFPPGGMLKLQRPAIVGSIIFAGVITPTVDPINQMLVALPIIALFEVGAIAIVISNRLNKPVPRFEINRSAHYVPIVVPLEDTAPVRIPVPQVATTQPVRRSMSIPARPQPRQRIVMDILPSMG